MIIDLIIYLSLIKTKLQFSYSDIRIQFNFYLRYAVPQFVSFYNSLEASKTLRYLSHPTVITNSYPDVLPNILQSRTDPFAPGILLIVRQLKRLSNNSGWPVWVITYRWYSFARLYKICVNIISSARISSSERHFFPTLKSYCLTWP